MKQILLLTLCAFLLCPDAEARYIKAEPSVVKAKAKRKSKHRRARKRAVRKRVSLAADWDAVMRRNAEPGPSMMAEEYPQWFKNLSDQELDLYLKFRLTDAIPLAAVEAEARRRGVR